ncbi:MAG: L,D-transpeptidase [Clostridiales bacterium]|nr:L,D-transpeptidase [Clostridiales bacterium]
MKKTLAWAVVCACVVALPAGGLFAAAPSAAGGAEAKETGAVAGGASAKSGGGADAGEKTQSGTAQDSAANNDVVASTAGKASVAIGAAAPDGGLLQAGYEFAMEFGGLGAMTPLESFVYRYEDVLAERAALAEKKRLEREAALKAAEEELRKAEARKQVAGLTEAQLDELFTEDYYVERMRALGFYRDEFSDASLNYRNAVIRLQSSINHPVSGALDAISKKALVEDSPIAVTDELSGSASDGYWITINKSKNILTVYSGDSVHKKYPVATGKSASLTPEGKFSFVSKAVNPAWGGGGYASPVAGGVPSNPLGKRWMGLSIGGGGRYGVHGNASPRSIGTYASHGCVRMINPDVEELFAYILVGTPVWIGTDSKLKEMGILQYHNDPEADAQQAAALQASQQAEAAEAAGAVEGAAAAAPSGTELSDAAAASASSAPPSGVAAPGAGDPAGAARRDRDGDAAGIGRAQLYDKASGGSEL